MKMRRMVSVGIVDDGDAWMKQLDPAAGAAPEDSNHVASLRWRCCFLRKRSKTWTKIFGIYKLVFPILDPNHCLRFRLNLFPPLSADECFPPSILGHLMMKQMIDLNHEVLPRPVLPLPLLQLAIPFLLLPFLLLLLLLLLLITINIMIHPAPPIHHRIHSHPHRTITLSISISTISSIIHSSISIIHLPSPPPPPPPPLWTAIIISTSLDRIFLVPIVPFPIRVRFLVPSTIALLAYIIHPRIQVQVVQRLGFLRLLFQHLRLIQRPRHMLPIIISRNPPARMTDILHSIRHRLTIDISCSNRISNSNFNHHRILILHITMISSSINLSINIIIISCTNLISLILVFRFLRITLKSLALLPALPLLPLLPI